MKNNLLIISDGNGVDTDFKKWPQYLQVLLRRSHHVINKSIIGASNETIYLLLAEAITQIDIDYAIVQWSIPNRLDVVIDSFWAGELEKDQKYGFNTTHHNNKKWWVTSASNNQNIQLYHKKYIDSWQAVQRSQSYMISAAELLKTNKIDFAFSLCYNFNFKDPVANQLDTYPWIWHEKYQGISEFRHISKFKNFDKGLSQPHTLIQLDWIKNVLIPNTTLTIDEKEYQLIEEKTQSLCLK